MTSTMNSPGFSQSDTGPSASPPRGPRPLSHSTVATGPGPPSPWMPPLSSAHPGRAWLRGTEGQTQNKGLGLAGRTGLSFQVTRVAGGCSSESGAGPAEPASRRRWA